MQKTTAPATTELETKRALLEEKLGKLLKEAVESLKEDFLDTAPWEDPTHGSEEEDGIDYEELADDVDEGLKEVSRTLDLLIQHEVTREDSCMYTIRLASNAKMALTSVIEALEELEE